MKFIVSLSSNINNKFKKYLNMNEDKSNTDFEQWLQAMKMVARLPGGVPPEFRRKLWLALSEKYLNSKKICWEEEEKKCFNEIYGEDDEELGNQIVKDLHRTGSSLCSGPDGSVNQAKLKKILIGYARWNPEVGYCQGFNMLGAFILQVMDKNEAQSMKVMIFLVEGILPKGYFSGSLGGLQADMAVFRELMTIKLPRLAKHLNKLQRPAQEASFEPPLTNVFTMQWFLTLFCTCLPINCVLRVWDLILTDGNDILLRTALAIWSILEEKVFLIKTADDFYCKMGSLSSELLNSNLVDPNSLIERVIKYGPITNLQKMRSKHLKDIKVWEETKGLQLYYSGNQTDSDDESNLAVATARGLNRYRRTSGSFPASNISQMSYNKDRIALDISILKKQYEKLRERQRQAHIILTTAVAKQPTNSSLAPSLNVDQLLIGRTAITANKGRKIGPPPGAIPPARKPTSTTTPKQYKKYEISKSTENDKRKKNIKWKTEHNEVNMSSFTDHQDKHQSAKESESSSYSDDNSDDSSTSTSLCDEISDNQELGFSSLEYSSISPKTESDFETINFNAENVALNNLDADQNLDFISTISNSVSGKKLTNNTTENELDAVIREENSFVKDDQQCEKIDYLDFDDTVMKEIESSTYIGANDHHTSRKDSPYTSSSNYSTCTSSTSDPQTIDDAPNQISATKITSTSQLSPVADISNYLGISSISPLKSPSFHFGYLNLTPLVTKSENEDYDYERKFDITEQGVTNEYFERINVERPKHLDLSYSSIIKTEEIQNEKVEILPKSSSNSFYNKISTSTKDESILIPDSSTENFSHTNLIFDSQKPYFDKTSIPNDEITSKNQTSENQNLLLLGREDKIKDSQDNTKKDEKLLGSICNKIYTENSFLFSNQNIENLDDIQSTLHTETISFKDRNENEPSPSDKVLKIIEENSLILHKILKKTIPDYSPVQTKMPLFDNITTTIADTSYMTTSTSSTAAISSVTTDIQEQQNSLVSLEEELSYKNEIAIDDSNDSYKFSFDNTISTESKSFEINEYLKSNNDPSSNNKSVKMDGDDDNGKNDFIDFIDRPYRSRAINFQNVSLRTDDNITDQLESIKNTIKSIDSLCEEKTSSYKKEKCQKYIESLFENQNQNQAISIKNQNITTVATAYMELDNDITMSDNYRMKNLEVDNKNYEIDNYSLYPERFARNSKRALSPRYRKDEDREEYESRLGRDRNNELDNSPSSKFISECSKLNENKINDVISDVMSDEINLLSINGNSKSLTNINLETKSALKSSSSIAYTLEKPKIRHATVTSTMYDRFLSQKLEEKMINKNYLEIKEPKITVTATDRDNDYITDAVEISSRERLPNYKNFSKSRDEISSLINQNSLSLDPLDFHKKVFLDIYTSDSSNMKSCDNIVYKLRSESDSSVSSFSTTTAKTSEIEEITTTVTGVAAQKQSLHKSLELLNVDIKLEKIKNSNENLMKS